VLLVDDNPRNLQMLLQILDGKGYSLLVAKSGEQAVEIARKSRPAVVLLDVMMPGIDGFETCRRLKSARETRDAAVLFLSAAGETDRKLTGFAAGGVDYITKPIQGEEVVARVNTHLTIRRLALQLQQKVAVIEKELTVVQDMQRRLLPRALPSLPTLELAGHYTTSRYAGGDYYDAVIVPGGPARCGVLIADVSGHGTPAAVMMAMTRTVFHAHPELHADAAGVLRKINDHFEYLWEDTGFVTAGYGVYDEASRVLRWACAGHCPPMLYRAASGNVQEIGCTPVLPLVIEALPEVPVTELRLEPGDRLLLYTDGVLDRTNAAGEFFGNARLRDTLAQAAAGSPGPARIIEGVTAAIDAFAAGAEPPDDLTLLVAAVR
jgi:serine phosphatase RsbU (regulator of sigma subunit)